MTPEIKYLIIANVSAIGVFILQMVVKGILKVFEKNKEELSIQQEEIRDLKTRLKIIQESAEKVPKLEKDINEAHERIRQIKTHLEYKKGE